MNENHSSLDASLSESALELIDQICDRYEVACREGNRPGVEAFLKGVKEPVRSALVRELLRVFLHYLQADQRQRWQRGERVSVKSYLEQTPALREHSGLVFELICHEVLLREEREEAPRPGYYLRHFPDHEKQLLRFFEARRMMPLAMQQVPSGRGTLHTAGLSTVADPNLTAAESPGQTRSSPHALPFVPGYEVLALLGRGAMGVVYKARQIKAGRDVALKMVLAGGHAGPELLTRFRDEAEAIARLQHPHVVQIFEVGAHQGLPFFSLEFCAGGSLDKKLAGTPLPPDKAAELVAKLARGVQAAHTARVIHRDLKPANVLLAEDGTPKVGDFGLAKKLDEQGGTGTGAIMGTPSYMAPEQASGKSKEVGPAADVYALGAILYECLTGRPPFKAATPWDTISQVISDEPVPPTQLNAKVPRNLETICLKCLRKEASQRYGSAAELADDLDRFRRGEPIRAPVGTLERLGKWVRRNPLVAGLTAAAAILLLLVAVVSVVGYVKTSAALDDVQKAKGNEAVQRQEADRRKDEAIRKGEQVRQERDRINGRLYLTQMSQAHRARRPGTWCECVCCSTSTSPGPAGWIIGPGSGTISIACAGAACWPSVDIRGRYWPWPGPPTASGWRPRTPLAWSRYGNITTKVAVVTLRATPAPSSLSPGRRTVSAWPPSEPKTIGPRGRWSRFGTWTLAKRFSDCQQRL